jgi:glycosyltransferase involved in cell wall biosynthesis
LPVYNGERYLDGALTSILEQSYRDFELIISDNASTDGTEQIGRAFASADSRVSYRRNPQNVGLSENFNLLVPMARGRLFKWAAADDQLRPGYLERCVGILDADPSVVLAYARAEFIDGAGAPLDLVDPGWHQTSDDPSERLEFAVQASQFVNAVLGVTRTDALRQTRLLPRYWGGDFRVMAELSLLGKFVEIPESLYVRRIHPGSSGGNTGNVEWQRRYAGGARPGLSLAYWRLCRDRAGIVIGAPIARSRKLVLLGQILRTMRYQWRRLAAELADLIPRRS